MANLSADEIIQIGKQKGIDMSKYEGKLRQKFGTSGIPEESIGGGEQTSEAQQVQQPQQPQQSQTQGIIPDLLNKISPALAVTMAQGARGWQAASGQNPVDMQYKQAQINALNNKQNNFVATYDAQGNPIFTQAPMGHITQQPSSANPVNTKYKEQVGGLAEERGRGLKISNDLTENAVNNPDSNFQVSSVGPRGATSKNMTELGNESMIKQGAKGFGIQNQKVDQAIHAQSLINQYEGKPMPQMAYEDLVQTVSNLLSNGTGSAAGDRELLRQQTLYGLGQGTLSFLTGNPHAANSPEVINVLKDIVGRQGQVSQELRGGYMNKSGQGYGNDFNNYYNNNQQAQPQQSNNQSPVVGGMFNGQKIKKVTQIG